MSQAPSNFTRADARDLFVAASLAKSNQRISVLGQRLATRYGATRVNLLEVRSGRLQVRDLLARSFTPTDASPDVARAYKSVGPTPRLLDNNVMVIAVPAHASDDLLTGKPAPSALLLELSEESPLLGAGLRRSWNGLRVLGNLAQVLLDGERDTLVNNRLRALHRRGMMPRRPSDLAYLTAHTARDLLGFDGHCSILLWREADQLLEVMAHLAGDRQGPRLPKFDVSWSREVADVTWEVGFRNHGLLLAWGEERPEVTEIAISGPRQAVTPERATEEVAAAATDLVTRLRTIGVAPGESALMFPIVRGDTALGVMTITAQAHRAFTGREATIAASLALECAPPLSHASGLAGDFQISESVLRRTAAFDPDLPVEDNRPLTATLALLCDRLRVAVSADSVALLPYSHKRGELLPKGVAWAGLEVSLTEARPSPGGIIEQVLRAESSVEWHRTRADVQPPASSFVERWGIDRFYAVPLRAPDQRPLGVVFVNWRHSLPDGTQHDIEIARLDRQRTTEFKEIAEKYLASHNEWFAKLKSQRLLSSVYTELLKGVGAHAEDPISVDFSAVRAQILNRLLEVSLDLLGGTAGIFAEPSGSHDDLTVVAQIGHASGVQGMAVPIGTGVTGRCAEKKLVMIVPDERDSSTWPEGVEPLPVLEDSLCEIAIPISDGSNQALLLGVLNLENQVAARAYGVRDEDLALQIAQVASIAIGLTRQLEQLQSIARLGEMIDIANRHSEERVFQVALEEAARVTGSFAASARVVDRSGVLLIPVHHHGDPGTYAEQPITTGSGANGYAFRSGRTALIGDTREQSTWPREAGFSYLPSRKETRSECAISLQWRGAKIGVCNFEHRQPQALTPYRLYLQTVGTHISHALQQRQERDQERVDESLQLVDVLSAFYINVNHTLSRTFQSIEQNLQGLETSEVLQDLPEITRALATTRQEAEQGAQAAQALLAGSAGTLEHTSPVDVNDLLQEIEDQARRQLPNRAAPRVKPCDGPCRVSARAQMLRWCVWTVVDNSYRHAGDDVSIWVSAEVHEADGVVAITVDDDGPGLSAEACADLYSPATWQARKDPHGLGLIAASRYLTTMRGTISSKQSPRGGLRTVIELPWRRVTPEENR